MAPLQGPDQVIPTLRDLAHIPFTSVPPVPAYSHQDNGEKNQIFLQDVPEKYIVLFNIVCPRFPELAHEQVVFRLKRIGTTMAARPSFAFWKRKYYVTINNHKGFDGIHFDEIPFNAQIGLIAHELCHILDYKYKTRFQLIKTGLQLLSRKGKMTFEKTIDLLTIYKGFGYQLKDWAQYAMFDGKATPEYKNFKKIHYLNPDQIDSIIKATYSDMGRKMD